MAILGFIYIILLFALCFTVVHVIKLAAVGFKSLKQKPQPKPEPKPAEKKPPEPVYYIVEKKRRSKASYSEPREIRFRK